MVSAWSLCRSRIDTMLTIASSNDNEGKRDYCSSCRSHKMENPLEVIAVTLHPKPDSYQRTREEVNVRMLI